MSNHTAVKTLATLGLIAAIGSVLTWFVKARVNAL